VEKAPVSKHELFCDFIKDVLEAFIVSETDLDHVTENVGMEGKKKMIHEGQDSNDRKKDEPEPDENKDLLIHIIDG
jgi:hypothetical protein